MLSLEKAKDKIDFFIDYLTSKLGFNFIDGYWHDIIDGFDLIVSLQNSYFTIYLYYCPDYDSISPKMNGMIYSKYEENYLIKILLPPNPLILDSQKSITYRIITEKDSITTVDNILIKYPTFKRHYRNIKIDRLI